MSPELLDPQRFGLSESRPTKESDCYALGMVVYEVLSGRVPFAPSKVPVLNILNGEHPEIPQEAWFPDKVRAMLERCWKRQPGERPSLSDVLRCLKGAERPSGSYPAVDEDVDADSDDQSDTTPSDSRMFSLSR